MNTAQIIVRSVPMQDAAARYGFRPNKAGYIKCPFHHEKTASLKIYPNNRGWHCFGCGAGGDVIDFVKRLFNTDFKGAVAILNTDFGLCLSENKPSYRDMEKLRELRKLQERQEHDRRSKEAEYDQLTSEFIRLDMIRQGLNPESPADELCNAYVYAMQRLPVIEYMLDTWG